MVRNKTIDIVITSYFRPHFTAQCLEKIKEHTKYPHRIILIDNGSDQETTDYLWDAWENDAIDLLILNDHNEGLEPAKNHAFNFVTSEYVVDTDNDILCPPFDWLERLKRLLDERPDYAAIACPPQVFIGADRNEILKGEDAVVERAFVGGSLRIMRTEAVRSVGGWRSNPQNMVEANRGEEHYICGKLREKGWKVGYAKNIDCFHLFGSDEWGYKKGVEHYHRDQWPKPTDEMFGKPDDWYGRYDFET